MRLAEVREARGWTQERLAARVGVGFSHVAKLEAGTRRPSLDLLFRLAQTLEVEPWELLYFKEQPPEWQGAEAEREWAQFRELLADAKAKDVRLLRGMASKIWGK